MGFRIRKSFKVIPGVRVTVSKSGLSTSVGGKGFRVTRTASGRMTQTVGLGGISHTSAVAGSPSRPRPASPPALPQPAPPRAASTPGWTAPRWEKDLYKATIGGQFGTLRQLASTYPEQAPLIAALDGASAVNFDRRQALTALQWWWSTALDPATQPFTQKYLAGSSLTVEVAVGIKAELPFGRDALGLALAELLQESGQQSAAIDVVESLEPSAIAA